MRFHIPKSREHAMLEEFVHRLYLQLNPLKKGQKNMAITIGQEISDIQTAVNALLAEDANPTASVLTVADQASLDALASSVGAPTSTSTTPATVVTAPVPTAPSA